MVDNRSPDKIHHGISRRKALGIGVASAAGGIVAGVGASEGGRYIAEKIASQDKPLPHLTKESEQSMLNDIVSFRSVLRLEGLPKELQIAAEKKSNEWGREPASFRDELPQQYNAYGVIAKGITDISFGKNADRLVAGVRGDPASNRYDGFDADRMIVVNLKQPYPLLGKIGSEYVDIAFHEITGHGSDPTGMGDKMIYPWETLVRVEHGKWKMLSQIFTNEGFAALMHQPNMLVLLQGFGREVIEAYKNGEFNEGTTKRWEADLFPIMIEAFIKERGKTLDTIDLDLGINDNDRVAYDVGEQFIRHHIAKGEFPTGPLFKRYQTYMDYAQLEIYAELMQDNLIRPEGINPEVEAGCKEVLSAIQGKEVDLSKVRTEIGRLRTKSVNLLNK